MVEVVTSKEFAEFKKFIEDRLDKMEKSTKKRLDDTLKAFGELTAYVDKLEIATRERVDDVEEKSKSLWTRLREAVAKEAIEPVPE